MPFSPGGGSYAYQWLGVMDGKGEPPGGVALNNVAQGTGLLENGSVYEDPDDGPLEFWIWPAALNPIVGGGTYTWTLLGYEE